MADATDRRLYLVELDLRGLSSPRLAGVQRALDEAVRRENRRGSKIRYPQCIYAPDEQRCLYLFEAAGPDQVPQRERHRATSYHTSPARPSSAAWTPG